MLILLSPAKTLDFTDKAPNIFVPTEPLFKNEVQILANTLKGLNSQAIAKLMKLSPTLAQLTYERFKQFDIHSPQQYGKPALFAYQGDVYQSLAAHTLVLKALQFAQDHLLIVSGLYGLLRPFDLIQPYRLEMATKLAVKQYHDLYAFWQPVLTETLNTLIKQHNHRVVINLLSEEYAKAIDFKALLTPTIKIDFKDYHKGQYRIVGLLAKKARGLMAHFILANQFTRVEDLTAFTVEGYQFNPTLSADNHFIFER